MIHYFSCAVCSQPFEPDASTTDSPFFHLGPAGTLFLHQERRGDSFAPGQLSTDSVCFANNVFFTAGLDQGGKMWFDTYPRGWMPTRFRWPASGLGPASLHHWFRDGGRDYRRQPMALVFMVHAQCFRMCGRYVRFKHDMESQTAAVVTLSEPAGFRRLYDCLVLRHKSRLRPPWYYLFPPAFDILGPCFDLRNVGKSQQGVMSPRSPDWHESNPDIPIPSLQFWLASKLIPLHREDTESAQQIPDPSAVTERQQHASPLLRLNYDCLRLICSHLPPNDMFSLRLASPALAHAAPLDSRFWRNAFLGINADPRSRDCTSAADTSPILGFMFGFPRLLDMMRELRIKVQKGWEKADPAVWDWQDLVGKLAKDSNFEDGGIYEDAHPSFRNRRRLWRMLENIMKEEKIARKDWLRDMRGELAPQQPLRDDYHDICELAFGVEDLIVE